MSCIKRAVWRGFFLHPERAHARRAAPEARGAPRPYLRAPDHALFKTRARAAPLGARGRRAPACPALFTAPIPGRTAAQLRARVVDSL